VRPVAIDHLLAEFAFSINHSPRSKGGRPRSRYLPGAREGSVRGAAGGVFVN
jgi:hypothetical protein